MGRTTTVLLAAALSVPGAGFAQTPPNPTQRRDAIVDQDRVPVFRVTVVGRTTAAINYRPRRGETRIDFAGTPLMPNAKGRATIKGKEGYIGIDAKFDRIGPASQFGPEYLTYVLWAITPEGRARNLGEVQIDGDDASVQVTTELQAFGLVVTAEPYFAVTQPSDVVVVENVVREGFGGTVGNIEVINARYELLKRGSYLMNENAGRYKGRQLEPGAPLDLAEARNAVELARLAGADRFAEDAFQKAVDLLAQAEMARERRRRGNDIMMPARQAVQTAEDARLIALERQEAALRADQDALLREREASANERARLEEQRRREAEREHLDAEARRRQAEQEKEAEEARRRRLELERQDEEARRLKAENDRRAAEAARLAAEREKEQARAAAEQLADERRRAEAAKAAAEAARLAAEQQAQQAQAQARATVEQSEREKAELRERLREQLNVVLETRETARGLIVNLSDVLFDFNSATLKPGAREKLARIAGIILANPGLQIEIEGHTDSVGSDSYNQRLSEQRAESVRAYLERNGIARSVVGTSGLGESQPVASNTTAAGRQQNRRVELVVTGEAIGRRR